MKKKFINGLLMVALFVGFTSSMVSCKDYDDEKITNLEGVLADNVDALKKILAGQQADITNLQNQITNLKELQEACQTNCANFQTKIQQDLKLYLLLEDFGDSLRKNTYTKVQIDGFINEVKNKFSDYYTKAEIDNLFNTKLANYFTKDEVATKLSELSAAMLDSIRVATSKAAVDKTVSELLGEADSKISTALNSYITSYNLLNNIVDSTVIRDMITVEVNKINAELVKVYASIDEVRAKAEAAQSLAAADSIRIDGLDGLVSTLQTSVNNIETNLTTLQGTVATLQTELANVKGDVSTLQTKVVTIDGKVTTLEGYVATLQSQMTQTINDLTTTTTTANNAWAKAQANETAISNMNVVITGIQTNLNNLAQTVSSNYTELIGKYTDLGNLINENTQKISDLTQTVADHKAEAEQAHQQLTNLINGVSVNLQALSNTVSEIRGDVNTLQGDVTTLQTTVEQQGQKLTDLGNEVSTLSTNLSNLTTTVSELNEKVDDNFIVLMAALSALGEYLDKNITSIEINGTFNPMFGEMALPFDVRSNMLVAFRGLISDRKLYFPTRNQDYAALPDQWNKGVFTDEDLKMLGISSLSQVKGFVTIGENEEIVATQYYDENGDPQVKPGNAGTIYLTVNPTNRDFTGTEFTLINSTNNAVAAELSPLKKSNHVLTFGYTRAGVDAGAQSSNGFYETQVTVTAEDAKNMGLRLNLSEIKDLAANLKNWKQGISLTTLMNAVYDNINSVLDANAVKATWEAADNTFSTTSQYAIGIAGIKPLSFAFAKDIELDGIPGTDLAEDLLQNIINAVVKGLPEMDFINRLDIEKLELNELTDELEATITIHLGTRYIESTGPKTATFWFPYYEITGTNGEHVTITNTHPEVTVTVNGDNNDGYATIEVKLYMGDFIDRMGDYDSESYDNIKDQFNHLLDHANDFISQVTQMSFTTMGNDVFAQFQKFINELNTHFTRFTRPNRFFKPTIIVRNAEGMVNLSTLANYPTKVKGPIAIIPSNYNAEMLSPAFKKFVAVTDVKKNGNSAKAGNADCKRELDAVNNLPGFNQVIDGGFNPITFNGKAGYSYEFIYSAVDFSGKVVTKKFFLTVK
jgi:predicted  nucleic acid-binding Zn-ribbon protein/TolA-binding protein